MPRDAVSPALVDFLRTASRASLVSFRLSKQGECADLRRELQALTEMLLDALTAVELASLFIDPPCSRPALPRRCDPVPDSRCRYRRSMASFTASLAARSRNAAE